MDVIDILDNKETDMKYLAVYHSNLRNIGIFITISLAVHNFKYKSDFMKKKGKYIIPIAFLSVSLLLNVELIYSSIEDKTTSDIIDIVPIITLLLTIVLIGKAIYNFKQAIN
ncbi:MAG: hypothetical protein CMK44_08035 [Porticoccus sp.]|nr:hypothetical protein [Porticoccus sp.]|tara:strand:- start:174 stop:509 length:336 start_codon:yes stop_codon:yes gene_type:complete